MLAAHFNTLTYHFDEAGNTCLIGEQELRDLKRKKADVGLSVACRDEYRQAERMLETAVKRFSDLLEDLGAPRGNGMQLVWSGT